MRCEPCATNDFYSDAGNQVTTSSGGEASAHVLTLIVKAQLGADANHHDTDDL